MNLSDVQLNYLVNRNIKPFAVVAVNKTPMFTVQYGGGLSYYSLSVAVTTGSMAFKADSTNGTTTASAHTDGASAAGTLLPSETTVDTLGELIDVINVPDDWYGMLNTGLRADVTTGGRPFTLSAVASVKPVAGIKVYQNEGVTPFKLGYSITNRRFTGYGVWETDEGYINELHQVSGYLTCTTGQTLNIYEIDDGASKAVLQNNLTETLLASYRMTTATAFDFNFANDIGEPLRAGIGKRLYVEIAGDAAVSMPAPLYNVSFLNIIGATTKNSVTCQHW